MESYTIMQNVLNEILTMPEILTNKFMQNNLNKTTILNFVAQQKGRAKTVTFVNTKKYAINTKAKL